VAFTTSIELPSSIVIREGHTLDLTKVPANVLAELVKSGAIVILNNTYNGGGKDRDQKEKTAAMLKRMDAWLAGSFTMIERGESQYTAMREQYYAEQAQKFGRSRNEVDKTIKALVESTLGKDKPANFSNFLEAVATAKRAAMPKPVKGSADERPTVIAVREEIEKALAERTEKAAAERAKVAASVKLPDDLGL
jgi:hypothetical protein